MCEFIVTPAGEADLQKLDSAIVRRVPDKIRWLAENCEVANHEALKGRLAGYYRLRAGNYRVVYSYDPDRRRIVVFAVGHRREVYKP